MYHGGTAIWGGSRVELAEPHGEFVHGTQGINRGQRRDGEVLVELDDGRHVRLPLTKLVRIDKETYVEDAVIWKPFPEGRLSHPHWADVTQAEHTADDGTVYTFRGWSGKWYVEQARPGEEPRRSKFFPNQRLCRAHFDHVAYGA